jgi:hypothetical protein
MSNIGLAPRNQNERDVMAIMTRCHNWLADQLQIDSKMEFGRTAYWGRDAFHAGLWYQASLQSVLNFRNLYGATMERLLRIVAHEARHAVQYRQGLLKTQGRDSRMTHDGRYETGYWRGEYYHGTYKDAPWERDARAHEKPYSDMVIKAGIIAPAELDMRLSGKQDQVVYLESETRHKIESEHGKVNYYKASQFTEAQQAQRDAEFKQAIQTAGFKWDADSRRYRFTAKDRAGVQAQKKAWNKAKKDSKIKYCDKSIAFLTVDEENQIPKADRFWAAQANRWFYDTRPMQDSDLVY